MKKSSNKSKPGSSNELELRAENKALREQLTRSEALVEFYKFRRREVSKMLRVGFREWDEKLNRPTSYSPEMADVLGLYPSPRC